ncbi:MAG: enoyl-CoA hydratase/isomerase family protein [Frankia sp.]
MTDGGATGTIATRSECGVEFIEIQNPRRRNALTREMFSMLDESLRVAVGAEEIRVIVIQSEGPSFCSGLDLTESRSSHGGRADSIADLNRMLDTSARICGAISESRKPVIAAAQGPCVGIGTLIYLSCDLGFMTSATRLLLPRATLGAGYFGPILSKYLGPRRAKSLLLSPGTFVIEPEQAERWGLATALYPPDGFHDQVREYAQALARRPAGWLQLQKEAVDHYSASLSVREAIRAGAHFDTIAHSSEFARSAAKNAVGGADPPGGI